MIRSKQHLSCVRSVGDALVLETMYMDALRASVQATKAKRAPRARKSGGAKSESAGGKTRTKRSARKAS